MSSRRVSRLDMAVVVGLALVVIAAVFALFYGSAEAPGTTRADPTPSPHAPRTAYSCCPGCDVLSVAHCEGMTVIPAFDAELHDRVLRDQSAAGRSDVLRPRLVRIGDVLRRGLVYWATFETASRLGPLVCQGFLGLSGTQ